MRLDGASAGQPSAFRLDCNSPLFSVPPLPPLFFIKEEERGGRDQK